jgi:hypothetical protein
MDTIPQQAARTIDVTGLPEEAIQAMQSLVALFRTHPEEGGPAFSSREEWARAVRAWAESHQPGATSADWSRESIYAGQGE